MPRTRPSILLTMALTAALVLGAAGGAGAGSLPASLLRAIEANWQCVEFPTREDYRGLCLYDNPDQYLRGLLITPGGQAGELRFGHTSHCALDRLALAPNGERLLVIASEEGHPTLLMLDVVRTLERAHPWVVYRRAVYPGGIEPACWDGKQAVVRAGHDLSRAWQITAGPGGTGGLFRIDADGLRAERVSDDWCLTAGQR